MLLTGHGIVQQNLIAVLDALVANIGSVKTLKQNLDIGAFGSAKGAAIAATTPADTAVAATAPASAPGQEVDHD